ncbi:MAG: FKBP-type peptidyl-prolyl cis-trans isomerase [Flavobacteriales bacterium]
MKLLKILLIIVIASGCKSDPTEGFKDVTPVVDLEESMIQHQRALLKRDSMKIEQFLEKQEWNPVHSGTGLRYEVYYTTELDSIESGAQVFLDYTITNLAQDTLYTSRKSGVMSIVVDYSQAETGLHELLKHMKLGESARAVIPAHLAHGLVGDDYKIPPSTSLVFDLTVL